ncbi:MAG: hypothetical protein AVDCRST_MAG87-1543, partial [uncultured Thermomicrobiales bacterium]
DRSEPARGRLHPRAYRWSTRLRRDAGDGRAGVAL